MLCLSTGQSCSNCPNSTTKLNCSCDDMHNYLWHFGNEKGKNGNRNEMKKYERSFSESNFVENKASEISKQTSSCSMGSRKNR